MWDKLGSNLGPTDEKSEPGIAYRAIATHLTHKAGFTPTTAKTGAVTLIQRFGGALNLNIHFHMLFLDGVYIDSTRGSRTRFRRVKAPTSDELTRFHGVFAPNSKHRGLITPAKPGQGKTLPETQITSAASRLVPEGRAPPTTALFV